MSPRATDNGMRVAAPAPAPSPIAITEHTGYGRRKPKKPLSSGFKAIVWTSPPPVVGITSTSLAASSSQRRESPRAAPSPRSRASSSSYYREREEDHHFQRTQTDVEPVREDNHSSGSGVRRSPRAHASQPPYSRQSQLSSVRESSAVVRPEAEAGVGRRQQQQQQHRLSFPPATAKVPERERRAIGTARSEEFGGQLSGRALLHLPPPAAVEGTGIDSSTSQSLPHSFPVLSRRPSSTDAYGNVVIERSLSDTSIVTASDFGGPKSNKPVILASQMSDEDAIEGLVALLAKGKGLPVVKHATGMGGGKSRKLLKLNQQGGWYLALCGMLPPYFKTKISVQDVDRVEAKWCCVVVHARGRSPVSESLVLNRCATDACQ